MTRLIDYNNTKLANYKITVDEVYLPDGTLLAESFGIHIEKSDGEYQQVRNITSFLPKIEVIISIMCDYDVLPCSLKEVIEDMM